MSVADSSRPSPRRGRNGSSDGSLRCATAAARSRSSRSASSRYSSSAEVSKISRCSDVAAWSSRTLTSGSASSTDSSPVLRALQQRRELDQLQVADDRVRDVEVGVEAQLAEPPADLGDGRQQLVAQQPERRLQRLGRAEQLLLARLPLAADRGARLLRERRRLLRRAAVRALRVGEHEPRPRARHRDVREPPHLGGVRGPRRPRDGLLEQRVRDRLEVLPPRTRHPGAHQPEHVDVLELVALGVVHRHHAHAARPLGAGRLFLSQAGVGDGRDRARELARGGLRRAAGVVGRELGEAGQVAQPLDDLGGGREQQLPAQPEPLDQPVDVEVGAGRVERARGRAIQLQERDDPLARLGRDLRRLERGRQRRDHVELAPAGDLGHAREVDRAQLDGRPRQRPHHRTGVARIDEQPQPRQQVAHLGALEERRGAGQVVRDGALLERDRDRLTLGAHRAHEHADVLRRDVGTRDQPLDVGRDRLRLRALGGAAPERDLAARRRAAVRSFSSRSSIGSTTARAAASTRPAHRCATVRAGSRSPPATRRGSRARSSSPRRGSGGSPGRRRRTR